MHNGGLNGYKMTATVKYWEKVQKELKSMPNVCKAVKEGTAVINLP